MTNNDADRGAGFRLTFREMGLGCGGRLRIGAGGQGRFSMELLVIIDFHSMYLDVVTDQLTDLWKT